MELISPSFLTFATVILGIAIMAFFRPKAASASDPITKMISSTAFIGSQTGGESVINYSYTDLPWTLMLWDIYYFFHYLWAIFYVVWPMTPTDSGELSELSFTRGNMLSLGVHMILVVLQLGFIIALPFMVLLPVWTAVGVIAGFMAVNKLLCVILNGRGDQVEYHSDPEYAEAKKEHEGEVWIFINGVAAGEHWMKSNLNRLAVTFKRPILGIHNKTVLYSAELAVLVTDFFFSPRVERKLLTTSLDATKDVRVCYRIIKEKLYDPQNTKVVFILHSQGGIEGSLIIDWLLQELPQDLLSKLEVYTFGNAANHFNNPHRHVRSQRVAFRNPLAAKTDSTLKEDDGTTTNGTGGTEPQPEARAPPEQLQEEKVPSFTSLTSSTCSSRPSAISDRAIGHIEHYAHTTDFVALWGVLHFTTSTLDSPTLPRFIGRVFARSSPRGGHQFVQHYLDGMFPLQRDANGNLLRDKDGTLVGCVEEGENEFMESEVVIGGDKSQRDEGDEIEEEHDGDGEVGESVQIHSVSPIILRKRGTFRREGSSKPVKMKVRELSRLWQYRDGRNPEEFKGRRKREVRKGVTL
ncbi:hypothetical protein B0T21DRAFT_294635 [Apiosordaria backusii]|uniref:DUF676 domain-containing protein n=1 Tax=Apiosordaria backusii TaxID=314023 RepID=A0AA40AT19_9PEZI|nr:hypothetical protein B0T21DRAFT_294635 [Apiosordaria backusii]